MNTSLVNLNSKNIPNLGILNSILIGIMLGDGSLYRSSPPCLKQGQLMLDLK
jgi:hypothetical protein